MSESTRTPLKPRDIRRCAYALMRQCWLTLLLAAVLMTLLPVVSNAVEGHGEHLAQQAAFAATAAYMAEHPVTDDRADSIAWMAYHIAEDAYDDTLRPWELLTKGIDFINALFTCIIALGLCHGLLSALRGGECTPHSLLLGWPRFGTACHLTIQTGLRVWGWALLPMLLGVGFVYGFGEWAEHIFRYLIFAVAIWAILHYCLAVAHLADDPDGCRTARECLRLAVDDADAFGVWQMCRVLWPFFVLTVADLGVLVAAAYLPVLTIPAQIFDLLYALFTWALPYASLVCLYEEMRQRALAAAAAVPENEGLARARALAQEESLN